MPVTPEQVRQFLLNFKQAAEKEIYIANRDKNRNFIAYHGFSISERKDIILGLHIANYVKGPEPDNRNPEGPKNVWVFGILYEGIWIYIKLKLVEERVLKRAICISFHDAEFNLRFPYRR